MGKSCLNHKPVEVRIKKQTLTVLLRFPSLLLRFRFAKTKGSYSFVAQTKLFPFVDDYPQKYFSNIYMLKSLRKLSMFDHERAISD